MMLAAASQAQFDAVADTIVCSAYVVDAPTGIGLSDQVVISQAPLGGGYIFQVGEVIVESTQVFLYDPVTGFDECFSVLVYGGAPSFYGNEDLLFCDRGVLPIIGGDRVSSNVYYSYALDGSGLRLYPGSVVTVSSVLYLHDGVLGCSIVDSIEVSVVSKPILEKIADVLVCDNYTLPEPAGFGVDSFIYIIPESGQILSAGESVSSNSTIVVHAFNQHCSTTDTFLIEVVDTALPDVADITVCRGHWLFVDDFTDNPNAYFYSEELQDPTKGFSARKDGTYCLRIYISDVQCGEEVCFEIDVVKNERYRPDADTVKLCRSKAIWLSQVPAFYDFGETPDKLILEGVELSNYMLDGTFLEPRLYEALYIYENHPSCGDDTLFLTLDITDDCPSGDITLEATCEPYSFTSVTTGITGVFRGTLYTNADTPIGFAAFNQLDQKDTLKLQLIYGKANENHDTLSITILPYYEELIAKPLVDSIELCYGDLFRLSYLDSVDIEVFWNIEVYLQVGSNLVPIESTSFINPSFSFGSGEVSSQTNTVTPLFVPNATYIVVVNEETYQFIDTVYNTFSSCITNEQDTIVLKTKANTRRLVNDLLCANDTLVWGGKKYYQGNATDTVILSEQAANGCDSFNIINLDFLPLADTVIARYFCDSSGFVIVDCERFDIDRPSGELLLSNTSATGCDSLVRIELTFTLPEVETVTVTSCNYQDLGYDLTMYENGSTYYDTIRTALDCDSILQQVIFDYVIDTVAIDTTLCEGDVFVYQGFEYTEPTILSDTLKNSSGCDSVFIEYTIDWYEIDWPEWDLISFMEGTVSWITIEDPSFAFLEGKSLTDSLSISTGGIQSLILYHLESSCVKQIDIEAEEQPTTDFLLINNVYSRQSDIPDNRYFYLQTAFENVTYSVQVYDRWGNLIWLGTNLQANIAEDGWDGGTVTSGVYVAIVTFTNLDVAPIIADVLVLD